MNRASVFEWPKRFKEDMRDDERYGRSKEVNTPQLIGQRVRVRVTMLRFCEGNVPGHSKRARTCLACRAGTDMAASSMFDEGRSRTSER